MSSTSNSEKENPVEKTNLESIAKKDNETKLETDLKSLQMEKTINEAQSSTTEEVKKKLPTPNICNDEPVRSRASSTDSPKENNSKFDTRREIPPKNEKGAIYVLRSKDPCAFQAKEEAGTSDAKTSNWRSPARTHNPRETKQCTSVSQTLSWRDSNFKYERCKPNNTSTSLSRRWMNEDSKSGQDSVVYRDGRYGRRENLSSSFEDRQTFIPTFAKFRERSKMGNWTLSCAPDIVLDNGLTEVEHVRKCINELHEQNGELFARRPSEFETSRGGVKINCFTPNYEDKLYVARIADILLEKIVNYPYCFYYFVDKKPIYMKTCEGELYENRDNNWKMIDFDEQ